MITTATTGRRPSRRSLARPACALVLGLGALVPAGAVAAVSNVPGDGSTAARSTPEIRPERVPADVETLRLRCAGRSDVGVVCNWSAPTSSSASGIRLVRTPIERGGRITVYRSSRLEVTETLDDRARPGVRYAYVVLAVNDDGRIVGRSRPQVAGIAPTPADVEVLRLDCRAGSDVRVTCEWSLPSESSSARSLALWRSVDGGERELVARFGSPLASSFVDTVPTAATRVRYAVIAHDATGEIVARSRATTVGVPNREPDDRSEPEPEPEPGPEPEPEPAEVRPVLPTEPAVTVPEPVDRTTAVTTTIVAPQRPATGRPEAVPSDDRSPVATDGPPATAGPDRPVTTIGEPVRDAGDVTDDERPRGGRDR